MTRDDFRKVATNLLAVANGKKLQFLNPKTSEYQDCFDSSRPTMTVQFLAKCRIKPEPVLRLWTEAEIEAECIKGTVLRHKESGSLRRLERGSHKWVIGGGYVEPVLLRDAWVIAATGAPCGVIE